MVLPTDSKIYKYGNIQYSGTNLANDLIDCSVNYETSLRVQIQYRIRVVGDIDIETYPEGFDPNTVFVQGPMLTPNESCSEAYFTRVPGDIGLWRAGAGDVVAQQLLGTVDGYTYAIPMFAIARRNKTAYHYDTHDNGSARNRVDYLGGIASDRPDGLYNDIIVAGDILDLRHRVGVNEDYSELARDAFNKLTKGKLRTKMSKVTPGEDRFGVLITQADRLYGDGMRRVFSNAAMPQFETVFTRTIHDKIVGTPGISWDSLDQIEIDLSAYSIPVTISHWIIYCNNGASTNHLISSVLNGNVLHVTIYNGTVPIVGTSEPIQFRVVLDYPAGNYGLTKVPEQFLEFRQYSSGKSIASKDMDIPIRDSSSIGTIDGTFYNTLMNHGGSSTENYDFGHQILYHAVGNNTGTVSFKRDISGYNILGLARATINGITELAGPVVTRTATDYTATFVTSLPAGKNIELALYTDTRFFDTNKQGRAITDSFIMKELTADQVANGSNTRFTFDNDTSGNLAIQTMATYRGESYAYAYVDVSRTLLSMANKDLPDATRFSITFATPPSAGSVIRLPVMARSPIPATESYICYYETVPYQGILDSSTVGYVAAEGPAVITTAGSGAITDYTYSAGYATFTVDTTTVVGSGTMWEDNVKPGFVIRCDAGATSTSGYTDKGREYVISSVDSSVVLRLENTIRSILGTTLPYTILQKDQPYFTQRNILDRLPMYDATTMDSSGQSYPIATAVADPAPVLETRIINRVQDITKDAVIGVNDVAPDGRGRSTIHMSEEDAPLGNGNLGLKFENLTSSGSGAQKTYQAYAFDKDSSGHLCLMVVGSESPQTSVTYLNEKSDRDVVDLFELPGRPIINPNR